MKYLPQYIASILLLIGIFGLIPGPIKYLNPILIGIHKELSPELVGIGITILVIDWAVYIRQNNQKRQDLIGNLGYNNHSLNLISLYQLKNNNWHNKNYLNGKRFPHLVLKNISMQGLSFRDCDLSNGVFTNGTLELSNFSHSILMNCNFDSSVLFKCNFSKTDLYGANFSNADLTFTNFTGSLNLSNEQLKKAKSLWGAKLVSGELYDGSFNLDGDIKLCEKYNFDYGNPEERKKFYSSPNEIFVSDEKI